jgi:hypothetical protein
MSLYQHAGVLIFELTFQFDIELIVRRTYSHAYSMKQSPPSSNTKLRIRT